MSKSALLEVLTDLNENRRLSFEVGELIEPFEGKAYALSFSLVSSSNTLGNRFGSEYNGGATLTCKLEGGGLEANVQTTPGEQAVVDGLVPEATFEMQVTLLDFDALYQRAIFGSVSESEEPVEEAPTEKTVDEPVVVPPAEVVAETVESAEGKIEEPELVEEPETPAQATFMEELKEEVVEESIPAKEEKKEEPKKKDFRKERKKLIDQLSDTVGAWRTSSDPKAPYEDEEEEEKPRETYYEGEESEWEEPSKQTPPWEDSAPPVYTSEPEKQGCGALSGCLKVVVVAGLVLFVMILVFTLKPEQGDDEIATLKIREINNMPLALEALAKKELGEEDRFYLRSTAEATSERLSLYYKGRNYPYQLTPGDKEQLAKGYAWVALAAEADDSPAQTRLYDENSRRKHPFHLLDDWFLIKAKVRVALRRPEKLLDEKDYRQVTALDLSNEKFEETAYLLKLPSLERLNLANNRIRNLKPLAALKKLADLNLDNTTSNALSSLTKVRSLRRLDLSNNEPTHLILLGEMKNLKQVTLTPNDTVLPQLETLKEVRPDLQITLTDPP